MTKNEAADVLKKLALCKCGDSPVCWTMPCDECPLWVENEDIIEAYKIAINCLTEKAES